MATTQTELLTEQEYREFALGDGNGQWELVRGQLREKPGMSAEHGDVTDEVATTLRRQLDRDECRVRTHHARTRVSSDTYYVPDIAVVPARLVRALRERSGSLDAYDEALPLVVEIWSPSTGSYDIGEKLPHYQQRGDLEILFIHPIEHTLTAWRRRPDGSYSTVIYRGGIVRLESLPGVEIDLDDILKP